MKLKKITEKIKSNAYYLYTISFIIIILFLCIFFKVMHNKSFVNSLSGDGFIQHFSVYAYLQDYYKEVLNDILAKKIPKMIDFKISSGLDILTTLNYYGYGDLLSLIMPLFKNEAVGYSVTAVLRLFFSGLAILNFINIKFKDKDENFKAISSITYAFSGFALQAFRTHTYFNNALIFLPIVLAGIENYKINKKKLTLILGVALSFITNFYFAYMICMISALYEIFNILFEIKYRKIGDIIKENLKLAVVFIEGILLSSFILIPIVYAFLNNSREISESCGYTNSLLFYPIEYYINLISGIVYNKDSLPFWVVFNIGGFAFLGILLLFFNKGNKKYKLALILILFGIAVPFVGKLLNGMSYVTNRWTFCLPLIYSFILLIMLTKIININKKDIKKVTISFIIYFLILSISFMILKLDIKTIIFNLAVNMIIFVGIIALLVLINKEKINNKKTILLGIVTMYTIFTLVVTYLPNRHDFFSYSVMENLNSEYNLDKILNSNEFYRTEIDKSYMPNYSLLNNIYSSSYYYSLVPGNMFEYYRNMGVSTLKLKHRLDGLDSRNTILFLEGTKYFVGTEDSLVPYGFEKTEKIGEKYLYENKNYLNLGVVYKNTISQEEFNKLSAIEKEQTLLQAIVLDSNETTKKDFKLDTKKTKVESNNTEDVYIKNNEIVVNKENGKLILNIEYKKNAENYLIISNPKWDSDVTEMLVNVSINGKNKGFYLRNKLNNFYFDKDYIAVNLGYFEENVDKCELSFSAKGVLKFDDLYLESGNLDLYNENIQKLEENMLENINFDNNYISAQINSNIDGILQFSIPYSKGWKVFVDGEEKELLQTDMMYMGTNIEKGSHKIELKYETPYLKLGILISMVSAIIIICEEIIRHKKIKQNF